MSMFIWLCVIVYDSVFMYIMYNLHILSSQRFIDMYPIVPDMAPWKNSFVLNMFTLYEYIWNKD